MESINKRKISIIAPAFNEEDCVVELAARLTNVFQQNPNYDFEAILVENGSSDRTFELLSEIFGEVYENYNLNFPTKLVDLQPNKYSNSLQKILHELQSHRGHENFVRAKKLSPVDFFITT